MQRSRFLSLLAVLVIAVSCQNQNREGATYDTASDSTIISGLADNAVKLVKTGSIHFKVKDVEQSTKEVSNTANQFGGMIYHQSLDVMEVASNKLKLSADSVLLITAVSPQAQVTARIPSQQLEAFMYSVADLGYFVNSAQLHIDDKSLAYLENSLKQKNRQEVMIHAGRAKTKVADAVKTIGINDEAIVQQIANQAIDDDVQYSLVNLTLFQNTLVRKEVIANDDLAVYRLPFSQRLSNAVSIGWESFLSFLIAIAHLWMFILLAFLLFLLLRYWQKSKLTV